MYKRILVPLAGSSTIGTHGRCGVRRAVPGSVAERVSRSSPVPVMVVPPEIAGEPGAVA